MCGHEKYKGGPHGEKNSMYLSTFLKNNGINIIRLKTGTPPRILKSSINFDEVKIENGDNNLLTFSNFYNATYSAINIYGYEDNKNRESAIFKKIEKSQIIKVPKDKKVNMQFIYIEDFIKNLYSLVKSNHINETYNVTNPQVISLEEYINTYGEIIGKKPNIKYVDKEVTDDEFKEDFNINYLDIDKLIQHGLYIPNILFRDGISKVYDSYKESNQVKKTLKYRIVKALQIV